jgi:hypothetical protein
MAVGELHALFEQRGHVRRRLYVDHAWPQSVCHEQHNAVWRRVAGGFGIRGLGGGQPEQQRENGGN